MRGAASSSEAFPVLDGFGSSMLLDFALLALFTATSLFEFLHMAALLVVFVGPYPFLWMEMLKLLMQPLVLVKHSRLNTLVPSELVLLDPKIVKPGVVLVDMVGSRQAHGKWATFFEGWVSM